MKMKYKDFRSSHQSIITKLYYSNNLVQFLLHYPVSEQGSYKNIFGLGGVLYQRQVYIFELGPNASLQEIHMLLVVSLSPIPRK